MIFKLHYALWYGALVGIIPFMFNYAQKYAGVSATQHGILYAILHLAVLLTKPFLCSVADNYGAHRSVLIIFIFVTILGFGSLAIYPLIPNFTTDFKHVLWPLYCLSALVGNTSMCVVNSVGDTLAIHSSIKKNKSYGEYRLWGPVGFGIMGLVWGLTAHQSSFQQYIPGIFTMIVILVINMLFLIFWSDHEEFVISKRNLNENQVPIASTSHSNPNRPSTTYRSINADSNLAQAITAGGDAPNPASSIAEESRTNFKTKLQYLKKLCLKHYSIFGYFFLFTFCGTLTSMHWQFFFKFLDDQTKKQKQTFATIVTLVIPVQSLGGELVFFLLSGKIMATLGTSFTLIICLLSFAARYLAYSYLIPVVNIYWILIIELLQGPAFGLMYCVLTHQANYYSECFDKIFEENTPTENNEEDFRNSLHSTLQGMLGAAFEGLGMALGSLIGGLCYDAQPLLVWKVSGYSALVVSSICTLCLLTKVLLRERPQQPLGSQNLDSSSQSSSRLSVNPNNQGPPSIISDPC